MKNYVINEKTGYTVVPNGILRNGNLSIKAYGLYFLLVSLPDDWNFSVKGLRSLCSDGVASIYSAVEELEKSGFLKREGSVQCNGKFSAGKWIINDKSENGSTVIEKPAPENPAPENPAPENPAREKPARENHGQLNIKQQSIKQQNTEQQITEEAVCAEESSVSFVADLWNKSGLPAVRAVKPGSNRYKMLKARLAEYGENELADAVEKAKNSAFLKGQNPNGWVITFDWFLKPNNFIKVLEGNYDTREKRTSSPETPGFTAESAVVYPKNRPSYDIEAFKRQALADDLVYVKRKREP